LNQSGIPALSNPSLRRSRCRKKELGGALFDRERGNIRLSKLGRAVAPFLENTNWCEQSAKRKAGQFKAEVVGCSIQHQSFDFNRKPAPRYRRQLASSPEVKGPV
jgi:hypothetical protein